jgi:hypothetical protein
MYRTFPLGSLPRLYSKEHLFHHITSHTSFLMHLMPFFDGPDILSRCAQKSYGRRQIVVGCWKGNWRRVNSLGLHHMLSEQATHLHFVLQSSPSTCFLPSSLEAPGSHPPSLLLLSWFSVTSILTAMSIACYFFFFLSFSLSFWRDSFELRALCLLSRHSIT